MAKLMRDYLQRMTAILRANDPDRTVTVSAFFRGRTAPEYVVGNFSGLLAGTGIDILLLQDGIGVGDPPLAYIHLYYEAFTNGWNTEADSNLPSLWAVIETFKQVSGPDEPFAAVPAPPERLKAQRQKAAEHVDRLILFTFDDYLRPDSPSNPSQQ
jgi:hypothetical protein